MTCENSVFKENDILDLHDKIIYVTMYSGHSNYITRKGNNPKLDPYADYDHLVIDLFDDTVYSVDRGFKLSNLKAVCKL